MNNKDYTKLLNMLVRTGVCKTGKRYLKGTDKGFDTLVKVMKGWPEYLYEHSEVAIKLFRKYIDKEGKQALAENGIYFDFEGCKAVKSNLSPIFIVGRSNVNLAILKNEIVKVYAFNESKANLLGKDSTFIDVEAWNDSSVEVYSGRGVVYAYDNAAIKTDMRVVKKQYKRGDIFNGKEIEIYKIH